MNRKFCVNLVPYQRFSWLTLASFALFLAACAGDPETASREGVLAQQQLDAGNIRAAQETIAKAIIERDDLPELHLLSGRIAIAAGNLSAAFQAYENALGFDPANMEALQGVAQLGLRVGNLQRSQQAADQILSIQPDQMDALIIRGVHQLIRNDPADALATAQRILLVDPTNEGGTILKARSQFLQGQASLALETVRARERVLGRTEALALTELELLREAHDASGMLAIFAYLKTVRASDVGLRIDEANVRYKLGDDAAARAVLVETLAAGRPSGDHTASIVKLWREYDRTPLSPSDLDRVARTLPDTRLIIARHLVEMADPQSADHILKGLNSSDADGVRSRAAIVRGQSELGRRLADAVLEGDETQCDALIARASSWRARGHTEAAILDGQRAVTECPEWPAAAFALVAAYRHRSDRLGVHRGFADGVTRIPQDSALSQMFASWLEAEGRVREAVAEARRLTRKAPALASGWRTYLAICSRHREAGCMSDANAGLARSLKMYAIDLPPGSSGQLGLVGRLQSR